LGLEKIPVANLLWQQRNLRPKFKLFRLLLVIAIPETVFELSLGPLQSVFLPIPMFQIAYGSEMDHCCTTRVVKSTLAAKGTCANTSRCLTGIFD